MRVMHTKIDYTWLGKIENELRSSVYTIKDIHYEDKVEIETFVEEGQKCFFRLDDRTDKWPGRDPPR